MICINCNFEHDYPFCPNCGEKSDTPKITFNSMFNSGFHTITNLDKGFLFNVRNLFVCPGKTVRDYINGRRKNIFNPISFVITTTTLYLLADLLIEAESDRPKVETVVFEVGFQAGLFLKVYLKYFWVLSVVFLSTSTRLIFGKFNFTEHLAMNSFIIGQATLVAILGFALAKFVLIFNPLVYLVMIWLLYQVFKRKSWDMDVFFQSIGSALLFFIQVMAVVIIIGLIRVKMG